MNKTELSINELPQQRTKLPVSPNWAAEAGKGDEGGAACLVCQNERQFPEAIAASGRVRMYNKSEVENWLISLSNSSNTHEPSRFSGGTNELS